MEKELVRIIIDGTPEKKLTRAVLHGGEIKLKVMTSQGIELIPKNHYATYLTKKYGKPVEIRQIEPKDKPYKPSMRN